ncbi:MAG: hypothetical protein J6R92_04820 [Akkermansia sp.]|nr:hypothetical protein [Akkermansia sp.]
MNRSDCSTFALKRNGKIDWFKSLAILIPIAWAVVTVSLYYPGVWTNDTLRQTSEALSGSYNNWKPTLHTWLLGVLERSITGHGIGISFVIQIIAFAVSVMAIAQYYMQRCKYYALLVLILPLFFTETCMLVTTVGNDELAASCYLLYIAGVLWATKHENKAQRYVLLCLVWGILGFGMVLRHNAIPCVALLAAWGVWKCGIRGCVRIGAFSSLYVIVALLANCFLTYVVLKAEASYPLRFPLAADYVNLSIMEGKWLPLAAHDKSKMQKAPHECVMLAADCVNRYSPIDPYIMYEDENKRVRDYTLLKEAWINAVLSHPERYCCIKLFFFHQFLLQGRCVPWLCEAIRGKYPHVQIFMEKQSRDWRAWVNRGFLVMSIIPLSCYVLLFVACIKARLWLLQSEARLDAAVFMAVALVYTSSFLLLVLSATEFRFYIIRSTLCCVGGGLILLSMLEKRHSHT